MTYKYPHIYPRVAEESFIVKNLHSAWLFSSVDPLAHVTQAYREQLLEKALYSLVTPGYQNNNIVGPNKGSDG